MWGGSNHIVKPTQNMTSGNSDLSSGFEVAPKIFPGLSLHMGDLNNRSSLNSVGIEHENSPISPLLKLRGSKGQGSPLDSIFELNPTFRCAVVRKLYV